MLACLISVVSRGTAVSSPPCVPLPPSPCNSTERSALDWLLSLTRGDTYRGGVVSEQVYTIAKSMGKPRETAQGLLAGGVDALGRPGTPTRHQRCRRGTGSLVASTNSASICCVCCCDVQAWVMKGVILCRDVFRSSMAWGGGGKGGAGEKRRRRSQRKGEEGRGGEGREREREGPLDGASQARSGLRQGCARASIEGAGRH